MQEFRFKYKTDQAIQQRFKDHVMAHEFLMTEQAKKSPAFVEQLKTLPMFPMFYFEQPAPMPMPPMPMPLMGGPLPPVRIPGDMPVNPLVGGEAQLKTLEPQPNLEAQLGGGALPPIEPVRGI
jgi:hypothetical protein